MSFGPRIQGPNEMRTTRSRSTSALIVGVIAATLLSLGAPSASANSSYESQFVNLINKERAKKGRSQLVVKSDLVSVARSWSKYQKDGKCPDGPDADKQRDTICHNETAAVLAVRPDLVQQDRYTGSGMATPRPTGWTAFPFPSSILLYTPGEGLPDFDAERARRYFDGTVDRLIAVIRDVIAKWEQAGL